MDSRINSLAEDYGLTLSQILKDFDAHLEHLKRIVNETKQGYEEWEKERQPVRPGR